MNYKPRTRQQEAIDKMVNFVNSKTIKKGIFVYPTSFGKSVVIANVASKFPDKYFINVTTSKELLKQNYEKFTSYGYEADICSASLGSKNVGKITFATIGTLIGQMSFFSDKEVIILSDECHTGSKKGSQLDKFLKGVKKAKLIGTTATPLRLKQGMSGTELKMMNRDRDCIYTSIEDVVQIQEVVADKYWSDLVYDIQEIEVDCLELNGSGTDYTEESLKKYEIVNDIVYRCSEEVKKCIKEGRKSILIFVPFIDTALKLEESIDVCKAIYSGIDKKERDNVVSEFKSLKLKVVSQVNILSTGFDHPQLDAIIFARPTNSITMWYQGLGRGVRVHELKKDCKVVDISGNYDKFGKIEDINFQNEKPYGGWAAFSEDKLLTNYPLGVQNVPTKNSLKESYERELSYKESKNKRLDPIFFFGKYKNKKLSEVMDDKDGKNYLAWIVEPKTKFNFYGEKGETLKKCIYEILRLPLIANLSPVQVNRTINQTEEKYLTRGLMEQHTSGLKNIKDLNGIF